MQFTRSWAPRAGTRHFQGLLRPQIGHALFVVVVALAVLAASRRRRSLRCDRHGLPGGFAQVVSPSGKMGCLGLSGFFRAHIPTGWDDSRAERTRKQARSRELGVRTRAPLLGWEAEPRRGNE